MNTCLSKCNALKNIAVITAPGPEEEHDKALNPKEGQVNKLDAAVESNVQDKAYNPEKKLDAALDSYYSLLFKAVPRKQVASVPAKVVLDGKKKENELQSESFYSHGLELGKAALVQEKHKSVDVCDNNEEKYPKNKECIGM